jgi:hypothetical protein
MRGTVYIYIDSQNYVVYADFRDSLTNRLNPELKRFTMTPEAHGIFARYYQLRLHPATLKNVRS